MSQHPSYTYAGICTAGGIIGYVTKKSVPSLVAGVGLGALFGVSGYLIAKKHENFYGHLLAAVSSAAMVSAGASRYQKAPSKKIPSVLLGLGAISLAYQAYKVYQWRDE